MAEGEAREASQAHWSRAAEAWSKAVEEPDYGASALAAEWMLGAADLQPGERVLEVACGAGRVGLQAADLVGDDGYVLCSDFAAPMVESVRERAARLGLANVEARVLDAEEMSFDEDERFDAALCRFGYMLMPDPARALERTADALKPGGRVALAVWAEAEANPWLATIFNAVMAQVGAPPPEPGTPGPFALGEAGRLERLLGDSTLEVEKIERLGVEQTYDSPEAWWEQILGLAGPVVSVLSSLPDDDVKSIRQNAIGEAERRAGSGTAVVFPATVIVASARAGG